MASVERPIPLDFAGLAETLSILAYAARLEMLDRLRFPKAASEVRVTPHRLRPGDNPERAMSKQAVHAHLSKLVEAGLVHMETAPGAANQTQYFTANAPRLYALVEDLRTLCVRYAAQIPPTNATGTISAAASAPRPPGPSLTLVHGVYEGRAFALDEPASGPWVIGRRLPATIVLDYDPFVSAEHAVITRDKAGFRLTDARTSKNGTTLNWRLLPKGGSDRLRPADVVGVGRSLLVFSPGQE